MKTFALLSSILLLTFSSFVSFVVQANYSNSETVSNESESEFVRRAILTSSIESREPVDNLNDQQAPSELQKIYFFTEIVNKSGESITHRWFHNGRLEAEVVLNIGSARWRTYSSKNLVEAHRGAWQVEVVDQQNRLLATQTFSY